MSPANELRHDDGYKSFLYFVIESEYAHSDRYEGTYGQPAYDGSSTYAVDLFEGTYVVDINAGDQQDLLPRGLRDAVSVPCGD